MIKEHISQCMVKSTSSPAAQLRIKILAETPTLLSLHKELVATGLITDDEFWAPQEVIPNGERSLPPIALKLPAINKEILHYARNHTKAICKLAKAKKLDEKSFWTSFFQNDINAVTKEFSSSSTDAEARIPSDLQSLKDAALDFSVELMDFPDSTHDPLISAINKWSTILLPQTAAPCSLTHDVLSEHAVACLELKSQNEYISKTSGQHKADSDAPRPSLPFSWMDSNFKPRSLDLSGAFCSLDEVCERASPTDFLSSFLSAREDIKLFHDKAVSIFYPGKNSGFVPHDAIVISVPTRGSRPLVRVLFDVRNHASGAIAKADESK
ncbi:hypothetical protein DI09_49p20 [Mitosporidium daphniae]|uniref:BSD domain-containing protein n=1 Tax=Mitosporidium daphniae TaxID=1485682 RepID=A0A098VPJ2_9MICR|nr:uncharacterized protein DI09_49p20 [Mitosporidium daphniae]KGG50972.1 hypothetical protein DI09_49p20 [Mitosporidium daphniae]|eukprot:XP_013237420.1 uncharacterized protein DI09_49p20 [Mitosporidium daphniae]